MLRYSHVFNTVASLVPDIVEEYRGKARNLLELIGEMGSRAVLEPAVDFGEDNFIHETRPLISLILDIFHKYSSV